MDTCRINNYPALRRFVSLCSGSYGGRAQPALVEYLVCLKALQDGFNVAPSASNKFVVVCLCRKSWGTFVAYPPSILLILYIIEDTICIISVEG
jgi:hypothetical protein